VATSRAFRWHRAIAVVIPLAVTATLGVVAGPAGATSGSFNYHSPVSGSTLTAMAFHAGAVSPRAGTAGSDISFLPNVKASNLGSQPVNEVPIAADPTNPSHLLTGGNDYNCPGIQGFYASSDGGATWTGHCLSVLSGAFGDGDPNVAYDGKGGAYILGIDSGGSVSNNGIVLQKSTDNGVTWGTAHIGPKPFYSNGLTDKEWTEADQNPSSPHFGCLYTSITQFDSSETKIRITVDHSCDGGTTWSGPVSVSSEVTCCPGNVVQFSDLAVGGDGTVYLSYMFCSATGTLGDCGGTTAKFFFSKSTDGGATWSTPAQIGTAKLVPDSTGCCFYGNIPGTNERVSDIPAIDVASDGSLYVVYYDDTPGFMQLKVQKSSNGGTTWGSPVVVSPASTSNQFFPWLSVNRANGSIGVTYLSQLTTSTYGAFVALSANGGTSFKGNKQISTSQSTFSNDGFGGSFMGDYTGNIWAGRKLYASWMDTRTGNCQDWTGGLSF
jgi:hypothetical protein